MNVRFCYRCFNLSLERSEAFFSLTNLVAYDIEKIEYYVDDMLKHVDTDQPFSWRLNEKAFFKKMTVKVKAYSDIDEYILKIQKIIQCIDSLPENYRGIVAFDVIKSHFENLERDLLEQSNDDSIDVVVFNLCPNLLANNIPQFRGMNLSLLIHFSPKREKKIAISFLPGQ